MVNSNRQLTADGRSVLIAAAMAAGITLGGLLIAGILLGLVAALGSIGSFRFFAAILTGIPAGVGAWFGASRAVPILDHGLPAAAVGLSGALLITIVLAILGNIGSSEAAVGYAIVAPVFGALVGAWLGGIRHQGRS